MSFAFWLFFGGIAALAALQYGLRRWVPRPYTGTGSTSRVRFLTTDDQWPCALYEYDADSDEPKGTIALAADLGEAPHIWAWSAADGWVGQLQRAGYHVRIICLRGNIDGEPRRLDPRHGWGWWAEKHVEHDLPTLLDALQQNTDKPIHWLGRGFGGVLPLLAGTECCEQLHSIAIMDAGAISQGHVLDRLIQRVAKHWPGPSFPMSWLYQLALPPRLAFEWCRQLLKRQGFTTSREALALMHQGSHGFHTTSAPALQQWLHALSHDEWLPPKGSAACDRDALMRRLDALQRDTLSTPMLAWGEWKQQLTLPAHTDQRPLPTAPQQRRQPTLPAFAPLLDPTIRGLLCEEYIEWLDGAVQRAHITHTPSRLAPLQQAESEPID